MILGRYTPTLDTVALLVNTEDFKPDNFAEGIFSTKNPLEKAIQYHEFWGHVALTKKSSFWTRLFIMNFYSYLGFLRMLKITEAGLVQTKLERIKKDTMDIIVTEEILRTLHNKWRPLQETMANAFLLSVQKRTEDTELKKIIETLVWKNNEHSKIITQLTKVSELILEEIGLENGWKLLVDMSMYASSPDIFVPKEMPKNQEDLLRLKKEGYEKGYQIGKNDPALDDPTGRFVEMIVVVRKCMDEIKKSLRRGCDVRYLASNIANMCGHPIQILPDQISVVMDQLKLITENKNVIPDASRRAWHSEVIKSMGFFKEISQEDYPMYWFINDINSDKIYFTNNKIIAKNEELWQYIHGSILKYQFLKSLEKGEDFLTCFDNKFSYCKSDCTKCGIYNYLKVVRNLYKVTSDFSYEDLRREAMDTNRIREGLTR